MGGGVKNDCRGFCEQKKAPVVHPLTPRLSINSRWPRIDTSDLSIKYFFTKTKIILVDFFGGEDIIDISEKSEKSS